ncbi:glucose-6-phosphate dehydrogenase assembly protein OpcA [Leptolyngbya sp. 'hensonii']|uniref:glucose-6-phosphate dehydrogenase assembly protein OpcA n=1 Tax=Leptolyngbya sp. 'hensonii' TaxID=1922337 RepID=UPI00094F6A11|nr:glucose-6-phosphate dehydrogenase assembly protein OpcA [Leptolyngbya sp. 'hensonii']OLP16033.1 glucose-6-phosphate dehydrogenase assembly protein OpcA [Leptolyngbya sp. 'hensonii']
MATQSAPLVSLQAPKDVSLSEIEAELSKIWQSYGLISGDGSAPAATRAATFTLVVYEPEETQQLLASLGFYTGPIDGIMGPRLRAAIKAAQEAYGLPVDGRATQTLLARLQEEFTLKLNAETPAADTASPAYIPDARGSGIADAIASQNPCRIIALCPISGEDEGVSAQVSAYCPIQKQSRSVLICCEYITLKGTEAALSRVGSIVNSLLIADLPKFAWWKGTPIPGNDMFELLTEICSCVIVDSSHFQDEAEEELVKLQSMLAADVNVADLNWRRLAAWQELTAEAFDPPERRAALTEVDRVTIDYEKGNSAQAMMFLGWLASRLQWQPISYQEEGGDYAIKRIQLTTPDHRTVDVELAAIPTGDWGEIAGDLVGLRLTSTNLEADCCTVLCSETTGCMRMEAGGNAQSCRVNQVTPLFDQKAETLLSQQLQRWGRDMLYEESMAVTAQIIRKKAEG